MASFPRAWELEGREEDIRSCTSSPLGPHQEGERPAWEGLQMAYLQEREEISIEADLKRSRKREKERKTGRKKTRKEKKRENHKGTC